MDLHQAGRQEKGQAGWQVDVGVWQTEWLTG